MTDKPNAAPWVIELQAPPMAAALKLVLDQKLVLGRRDSAGSAAPPDVDLGPYGAEQMGVSRHHLTLEVLDNQLMATDLDSGNGTLLNGERLAANTPRAVNHGDTLTLGRLAVQVRVVMSPTFSSVMHKQSTVQLDQPPRHGEGELVLVVEDDVEVARAMSILLPSLPPPAACGRAAEVNRRQSNPRSAPSDPRQRKQAPCQRR